MLHVLAVHRAFLTAPPARIEACLEHGRDHLDVAAGAARGDAVATRGVGAGGADLPTAERFLDGADQRVAGIAADLGVRAGI